MSKIDSLFKGRAYLFSPEMGEEEVKFAKELTKRVYPALKVKNIELLSVGESYDTFEIQDDQDYFFKLKVSLEAPCATLKKEASVMKKTFCASSPVYIKHGVVTIGEKMSYLLTALPPCRPLREVGRSILVETFPVFLECYKEFQETEPLTTLYKTPLRRIFNGLNLKKVLPAEVAEEVAEYTDYDLCTSFVKELERRTFSFFSKVEKETSFKCHGNLSLDSVLHDGHYFYFDSLENACMAHPFIDLADLMLDAGVDKETERELLSKMAETLDISTDLYEDIYQMCLGKKIAELLSHYIKEVYLYNSYRQERLMAIADAFSQCYERFRSVDIFEENRHFILKTITEPILGVNS